MKHKIKVRI